MGSIKVSSKFNKLVALYDEHAALRDKLLDLREKEKEIQKKISKLQSAECDIALSLSLKEYNAACKVSEKLNTEYEKKYKKI